MQTKRYQCDLSVSISVLILNNLLPNQLQLTYLMMSNNKPATKNINKAAVNSSVTNRPTKLGEGAARPGTTPNKPPLKREELRAQSPTPPTMIQQHHLMTPNSTN